MSDEPTSLKTLKLYWRYWMRYPWLFAVSLLLGPAYVLQNIVSLLFIAKAIGHITTHGSVDWNYVVYSALSLSAGILIWFVIDKVYCSRLDSQIIYDMYEDGFHHFLAQEYDFFADNFTGSLVTQTNRFIKSYELFHVTFFLNMLGQFCGVLVALGVMISYSVPIGLLITLLWIISITTVCILVIKRMPHRRAAARKESQLTGELADSISNAVTIKTFAAEPNEEERYGKANKERAGLIEKSWMMAVKNNTVVQVLCAILQISLLIFGIHAIETHSITVATYLLFQVYILFIIGNVLNTTMFVRQVEGVLGDSHEMTLLFDRLPLIRDPSQPKKLSLKKGEVKFDAVDFTYDTEEGNQQLFKNFNLTIKPGERIGLVGPSGGGKTTITKLLLRFVDTQGGSITIDGQDIREVRQNALHSVIGYVPQEPLLFHRSLYENISFGNPSAKHKEILDVSKNAHADDFINVLPKGYDTLVGERGIKLSGGQRQRIAIARAMLKNAPILVLDEATSALDSESEKYIQAALWELMQGKTTLVIAHRLSTIQHLDRIVVLDEGKIIEEGSHKELLDNKGLYARLWAHQSGGFLES